jgi:LysM repeat protein
MFFDDDEAPEFWSDEPTKPLERIRSRMTPADAAPARPTARPSRPSRPFAPAPRRAHTGEVPLVPSRRGTPRLGRAGTSWSTLAAEIDPLMRRLGVMVLAIGLALPVAMALRSGEAEGQALRPDESLPATAPPTDPPSTLAADPNAASAAGTAADPSTAVAPLALSPETTAAAPATTAAPKVCTTGYKVVRGDSWSRIAQKVGVSTADMLAANNATTRTLLLPGNIVCMPSGATNTTTASPTTAGSQSNGPKVCTTGYKVVRGDSWSRIAQKVGVSTADMLAANNATTRTLLLPGNVVCMPSGATNTTTAPPTTRPTPTTKPTSGGSGGLVFARKYTKAEIEKIIRDVWPAQLEEWALWQAWKESRYDNNAYNSCCYGLYQINFNAHKRWLKDYGITSPSQLFDPLVNAQMGTIVFRRMGGEWPAEG